MAGRHFRRPWVRLTAGRARFLEEEFKLECSLLHPFAGAKCRAVAENIHDGHVLFWLLENLCDFAVVGLTRSGHVEMDISKVSCAPFVDWADFKERRMDPDVIAWLGHQKG